MELEIFSFYALLLFLEIALILCNIEPVHQNTKYDITNFNTSKSKPSESLNEAKKISPGIIENLHRSNRAQIPRLIYLG